MEIRASASELTEGVEQEYHERSSWKLMDIKIVMLVVLLVWNAAITGVIITFAVKIKSFTKDINKGSLVKLLEKLVRSEGNNSKQIKDLEKEILKMQGDAKSYIQKVALMRFNPFDELGGDHSFTLALLDAHDNGIIFTGLHTRERTRVYVKNIVEGKSPIELSKEEERVLKEALTK